MKLKKCTKLIITITFLFLVIFMNFSFSYGASLGGNIISGADNFISDGQSNTMISKTSLQEFSGTIYNILFVIGVIVATIVGVVLAIQFIIGSVEQKSKIKESLIPYFVGCAVIFGAFGIWKLVVTILSSLD